MGEPVRDTSGVTTRVVVLYVREHGGDEAVRAMLEHAGETRSVEELLDEHGWSTYAQKIRLFRAAAEVLGDPGAVRKIGQFMLRSRIALPLLVLLRALGSPEQVLRNVAKANSRFSTNSTVRALEVGNGHAVVTYRLHDGYPPDELDCQYTEGLLSLVPEVFGLPAASVQHGECQVHGAPACLFRLRWRPRHRWGRRVPAEIAHLRDQLDAITQRFQELQSVAADLVSTEDVSTVLARIATKASHAVRAPRYLLAARATAASPLRVHHQGFTEEEASALGERLIRGEPLEHIGSWLVADIASARCHYGKLGAVYAQEEPFFPEERQLLVAYARQAAAALDAATALEEARGRHATSRALLQLAQALANLASPEEVAARIAAAVPGVVAADRSSVSLWDAGSQRLSTVATHGWPADLEPLIEMFSVGPSDTPELAGMLADARPRCFRRGSTGDPLIEDVLARFQLCSVAVVPIVARGEFLGVVTAATSDGRQPLAFRDDTRPAWSGWPTRRRSPCPTPACWRRNGPPCPSCVVARPRSSIRRPTTRSPGWPTGHCSVTGCTPCWSAALARPCCSSTWMTSRPSTTASVTRWVMASWPPCPLGWWRACARGTPWPAWAVMSSPCCWRVRTSAPRCRPPNG